MWLGHTVMDPRSGERSYKFDVLANVATPLLPV